jgi:predicted esterase
MRRVVVALWLFSVAPLAVLAGLLLFGAVTWRGTFFAVTALGLLALPLVWAARVRPSRKALVTAGEAALIVALGLSAPRVPDFAGQGGLSQRAGGGRVSLFAWLPEVDQMVLGTWPLMLVDPALDWAHAKRLRSLLPNVYGELRLVGSTLGEVADPRSGQTFVYVPAHAPGERLPLLVFLHGSGANFVAYQALLRQWADAGRFVVVSPSFGAGNWQNPGGLETIDAARAFAEGSLPVDPHRVALVGLSNGGRGITRLVANDTARRWPVVVALSAVIEEGVLTSAWADRDVLLLHGEADERIGFDYFESFAAALEGHGARVERRSWPGEDHFLWFSRPFEIQESVVPFLARHWRHPAGAVQP